MTGRPPNPIPESDPGPVPKAPPQVKANRRAAKEWKRIIPELKRKRFLTEGDMAIVAMYCLSFARMQDAQDIVAKDGMLVKSRGGNVYQHPALGIANTAAKMCSRFAAELGLTPSSRSRIRPEEDDGPGMEMPGE